jgi:hypothetical protein
MLLSSTRIYSCARHMTRIQAVLAAECRQIVNLERLSFWGIKDPVMRPYFARFFPLPGILSITLRSQCLLLRRMHSGPRLYGLPRGFLRTGCHSLSVFVFPYDTEKLTHLALKQRAMGAKFIFFFPPLFP